MHYTKTGTSLIAFILSVGLTHRASAQPANGTDAEELWIENDGRHIYGVLSRPADGKGKQPLAILAHGFNGTHEFARNYFKTLNGLGYQCFAPDFPCGSLFSRSDGNTMGMSVLDERNDLEAVIRYFKSRPDIDADSIVLIGESQGGLVSALAASDMPGDISRLILVFPALCIPAQWTERYPRPEDIPDTTRVWGVPIGRRFFAEVRGIDVFGLIGKFEKPVLIVQGDADAVVSLEDSRHAVEIYKDARLHVIPGAGHGFRPEEMKQSLTYVENFLKAGQ